MIKHVCYTQINEVPSQKEAAFMPNVTIKDIAQAAGETHPTVSKALNNAPGVRPETRARILELARQMNYIPNVAAKRLVQRRNRSLGFIWPQVEGLFFYHLCSDLQREALRRNIDVVVSMSEPVKALRTFHEHFIDFTLAWFFPEWVPSADFIKERELYEGALTIIGGGQMENAHRIAIDRAKGVYDAVRYLAEIGHRKVAYIGEQNAKSDGYVRGLLDAGLPHHPSRLISMETQYYHGASANRAEAAEKFAGLWHSEHRPTALIIDSQDTAFALINCIYELGISIPEELSVISYDDIPELSIYQVPLTTCGLVTGELVRSILDFYEDYDQDRLPPDPCAQTVLPRLVIRESTRPPRSAGI